MSSNRGGGRGRRGGDRGGSRGRGSEQQRPPLQQTRPSPPPQASSSSSSAVVEELRTLSIASPVTGVTPSSSKELRPPRRPGYGTVGTKCQVRANHFLVSLRKPNAEFFHYDVNITPEVPSRVVNRQVLTELVKLHRESSLGGRLLAYDGRKNIYTAGALPFESKAFVINLSDKNQPSRRDREFKVTVRFAAKLDFFHLQSFLQGRQPDTPQETIQLLDVVLRATPSTKYTMAGRSFFSPDFGTQSLGNTGVECWFGYYQSLRPTQMGLSLNIDLSATSFFEPIAVKEFIEKNLNVRYMGRPMPDMVRIKVKKALRRLKVETRYTRIPYCITGVSTETAKDLKFMDSNNVQKSVAQYFEEKYKRLECVEWPCLVAGSASKPIYLPIEVCVIIPGQKYVKKLTDVQVRDMLASTCRRPNDREKDISYTITTNNYLNDEFVREFGLHVNTEPSVVDARILPAPTLNYYSKDGRPEPCSPKFGAWNMINKKMVNAGTVVHWACVNFSVRCKNANTFFTDLINKCRNMGMNFSDGPLVGPITNSSPDRIDASLRRIHTECNKKLVSQPGQHLQLLLIILPDVSGYYGRIKKICETELGIVSQCCQPSKVAKNSPQYHENVALKINVKVGGRNTVLQDFVTRKWPIITERPVIVFGADVTHPQPGEDRTPSIAAVVASMDWPEVTKYRCLLSAQEHRAEIITDLYTSTMDPKGNVVHGGMIRDHFIAFRRATNMKPDRLIFYRDGVSEGQFNSVLLHEVDAIRKACNSLEANYLPRITFIVVQKRHHTRLFPSSGGSDKSGNVLPGTVVDTKICHPNEFDFYLCSHAGIKGTSRPTHYHVLYDENGFTANALQVLTNNLCYTYARCTRSVSVVPPAYYAHLAAFRARYYLEEASDTGSTSGSGANVRERDAVVPKLPRVLDSVSNVMFYC